MAFELYEPVGNCHICGKPTTIMLLHKGWLETLGVYRLCDECARIHMKVRDETKRFG